MGITTIRTALRALTAGLALLMALPAGAERDPTPSQVLGAQTFVERCTLCHGHKGMGEGLMPLLLRGYPDTNLLQGAAGDTQTIRSAIIWGGAKGGMSEHSPPWGNELTWTEIESLVLFIEQLRQDPQAALKLAQTKGLEQPAGAKLGAKVFRARCALCHGPDGEGDGRLARVITAPPPANLTRSAVPEAYLHQIITRGGEALGRSPKMPPWGDTLAPAELSSVVAHVLSLRQR